MTNYGEHSILNPGQIVKIGRDTLAAVECLARNSIRGNIQNGQVRYA
jgi:hypothetical protein